MRSIECFPPVAAPDAQVLILGSIPSAESLRRGEYYGHPRNAFWPLMARLFWPEREELPYPERCAALCRQRIALWDVLRVCERNGSLDSAIVGSSERSNDFRAFFARHRGIGAVFFNGAKAERSFRQRVLPGLGRPPELCRMPSTSPALAALGFEQKLEAWRAVARRLGCSSFPKGT